MYQFNHYYRYLINNDEFTEKKATCRKYNIDRDLEFIRKMIHTNLPEYRIFINHKGEKGVLNEDGEVIIGNIYLESTDIFNRNENLSELKIEIFSDRDRTYYIAINKGKFNNMYLFGTYYKCLGREGMNKLFEHFLEWGQIMGIVPWRIPKWFNYRDVRFLQQLNSDCSIKLYKYVPNCVINGQYEYFQFGNDFHFIPMIGIKKDEVDEFKVISTFIRHPIPGNEHYRLGFFHAFITTEEFTVNEKTQVFCCDGAIGLTDLLHEYPNCDSIGGTYWRTEFYPSHTQ